MQFDEVLRTFTEFFDREGIRYALVGGLAVHAWGGSRSTRDLDLLIARSDRDRVIAFAESLGYETLQVTAAFSNHVHTDPRLGRVDFMIVSQETASRIFESVHMLQVVGREQARVASPEHLAMMKALAMKNVPHRALYEPEDIRTLLLVEGMNRKVVRDYFASIGLLELYDEIERAAEAS